MRALWALSLTAVWALMLVEVWLRLSL